METSTTCYVCHADKTIAFNRYLSFFQFPSGLGHLPDQVWRIKWLTALKFSPDIIDKPPTQIERGWIICERHFADSCFIDGKLLIHGSVPELYLDEMRSNEIEVITLSDDDNKPAKLHPNLPEEIASNLDSMKVGPDEDDIMILQEKGRDERSIVDSESDMAIDAKPEEPQKNDNGEVGFLPPDDESCASTILFEENRTTSPRSKISHTTENIQNDREEMIVDSDEGESSLNETLMSPDTINALCENLMNGFATKSFLNVEAMEMFSEYSIPNQSAGVPITNPAPPRELFEKKGSVNRLVPMSECSSTSNISSPYPIDDKMHAPIAEVTSNPQQTHRLSTMPIHSLTGMNRSARTTLPVYNSEVDDDPMVAMDVTPSVDFIVVSPFRLSNTILARDLFPDMNALGSPVDELSGLPDSPSGSNDVTLDDPEEEPEEQPVTKPPLGHCGKAYCKLGCICDSLLTSRPPCGNFFCLDDANSCNKHGRTCRFSLESDLLGLDMNGGLVEKRRERKLEAFIRENDGLQKRQVLKELYITRSDMEKTKNENDSLRSKLRDQQEEERYLKNMQRRRPVESPSPSGTSILGKNGMPLSETLLDQWANLLDKNRPCDFVAQLLSEMFTDHYLATVPELQESQIHAIITATMKRFNTCYLGEKKKGRPSALTNDLVKEFVASVHSIYRQ